MMTPPNMQLADEAAFTYSDDKLQCSPVSGYRVRRMYMQSRRIKSAIEKPRRHGNKISAGEKGDEAMQTERLLLKGSGGGDNAMWM